MANIFRIPLLNPSRWVNANAVYNPEYNTLPFDDQIDLNGYKQPWQKGGTIKIQLYSDFDDLSGKIYVASPYYTRQLYTTFALTAITEVITGVTFKCYEASIPLAAFAEGLYYGEITYDSNPQSTITASLTEATTPTFIDAILQLAFDGVVPDGGELTSSGSASFTQPSGTPYHFFGAPQDGNTGGSQRVIMQVRKDGDLIFQNEIGSTLPGALIKTGILKPGSIYDIKVFSEDTGTVYTPIDIDDSDPVAPTLQTYRSNLWDVREKHPGSLLYEYSNSVNDKDIIWSTGIVFEKRAYGTISNYEPGSDDEQYDDQYYNTINENSIPFRTFVNGIYSKQNGGLPDWEIDKFNLIWSLNQVSADGTYYNKFKGESFQLQRADRGPNLDAMSTIKIIPSDNLNLSKFTTTSPTGDNDIQVIVRDIKYDNKTGSWILAGEFTGWSELIGISFLNAGLDEFSLLLGTTMGGDDIQPGGYAVTGDLSQSISIGHRFDAASTLYVTVPNGVNLNKVVLYWYQYDAPNVTPPDTSSPWQFGTDYFYTPRALNGFASAADMLAAHWNLATGFGNEGTVYEGCQIDDITINKVPVIWNRAAYIANPSDASLQPGATHGITGNTITIIKDNLPNYDMNTNPALRYVHGTTQNGGNTTSALSSVDGGRGLFTIELGGSSTPIDITPDSYLQMKFYRIS